MLEFFPTRLTCILNSIINNCCHNFSVDFDDYYNNNFTTLQVHKKVKVFNKVLQHKIASVGTSKNMNFHKTCLGILSR